jgi:DnaJ-class molecular chaperone
VIESRKAIELTMAAQLVDQLDYYQVLKVQRAATRPQIKEAYYREMRAHHPDQFHGIPDPDVRAAVQKISARVTEAYTVLGDAAKRAVYDKAITADRAANLRMTEEKAKVLERQAKEEEVGKHPKGRELYRLGMLELEKGNFSAAEKNFKMALSFEPGNALYAERVREAGKNLKTDYKIK